MGAGLIVNQKDLKVEPQRYSAAEPQPNRRAAILAGAASNTDAASRKSHAFAESKLLRPGWPRADASGEILAAREDPGGLFYRDTEVENWGEISSVSLTVLLCVSVPQCLSASVPQWFKF